MMMMRRRMSRGRESVGTLLAVLLLAACRSFHGRYGAAAANNNTPFPAYFIFGDSLVDVGNNNYITSIARANNLPFGIDFPGGPTGRFTNGKTVTDVLCDKTGLPFPPPYLAPTTRGAAILKGVNYASAAGGIVRATGYDFIGRVDFDTQLSWFGNNIKQYQEQLGEAGTSDLLKRSIFTIVFGANDYVNNYLLRGSPTPTQYTPAQFQDLLITKYKTQLTQLYNLGARNVSVSSIGPIGCIPQQLSRFSANGECYEPDNQLAIDYNVALKAMLAQLTSQLPGSIFVYAEIFDPIVAYRNNPSKYGFKFGDRACCGAGRFNGNVLCLPLVIKPCSNRDEYVFFDAFHTTQRANELLGSLLYQNLIGAFIK